jgi:hypothetical protein
MRRQLSILDIRAIRQDESVRDKRRLERRIAAREQNKPVYQGEARQHMISKIMDVLRDWRQSPFEHEADCRTGLRSGLCLQGEGWKRSDDEAAALVAAALRRIGAVRPTWDQGQREFSLSEDYCSWCMGPIEDRYTAKQRYCSVHCAKLAVAFAQRKNTSGDVGRHVLMAKRIVQRSEAPPRDCGYCGKPYRSENPATRFCSHLCAARYNTGDLLLKDIVCVGCGKTTKPSHRGSKCCSKSCATAVRLVAERARLSGQTRNCKECFTAFTPTMEKSLFCSERCNHRAAGRAWHERNYQRKEHHLTCRWCGTGFVSRMPFNKFCTPDCRTSADQTFREGRPKPLTTRVFDYAVWKMAA